jgi:hypothetical protein
MWPGMRPSRLRVNWKRTLQGMATRGVSGGLVEGDGAIWYVHEIDMLAEFDPVTKGREASQLSGPAARAAKAENVSIGRL